jgi:hypothetical protein
LGVYSLPLDFPIRFKETTLTGEDISSTLLSSYRKGWRYYKRFAVTLEKTNNRLAESLNHLYVACLRR